MRTSRNLALVAIVLFVTSHFLPAYVAQSGFSCFEACWDILFHDGEILSGGWFYYSGFVIASILFLGLVTALFATQRHRKVTLVLSVVCFLQVFSWMVVHIFVGPMADIKIGYYLWLLGYSLLVGAHLLKRPVQMVAPIAIC